MKRKIEQYTASVGSLSESPPAQSQTKPTPLRQKKSLRRHLNALGTVQSPIAKIFRFRGTPNHLHIR